MIYEPAKLQQVLSDTKLTDEEKIIFLLNEYSILYHSSLEAQKLIIDECKDVIKNQGKLYDSYIEDIILDAVITEN